MEIVYTTYNSSENDSERKLHEGESGHMLIH